MFSDICITLDVSPSHIRVHGYHAVLVTDALYLKPVLIAHVEFLPICRLLRWHKAGYRYYLQTYGLSIPACVQVKIIACAMEFNSGI